MTEFHLWFDLLWFKDLNNHSLAFPPDISLVILVLKAHSSFHCVFLVGIGKILCDHNDTFLCVYIFHYICNPLDVFFPHTASSNKLFFSILMGADKHIQSVYFHSIKYYRACTLYYTFYCTLFWNIFSSRSSGYFNFLGLTFSCNLDCRKTKEI